MAAELGYIIERITDQRDLIISDANFGMYKQDLDKAKLIDDLKNTTVYPERLVVSTGKNQKERVLKVAEILNGSLSLAASVQSTDEEVLKFAKRSNISVDGLKEVGAKANNNETGTYTEIILGLPGDSKEAHFKTLEDTLNADFDIIRMYQLILLPQTEFNTPACREKFGMESQYRIMPRSFGEYEILGDRVVVAETEQIVVSNNTLSNSDYLDSREMDLVVEIIHNGKVFSEISGLVRSLGLSWYAFIFHVFQQRMQAPETIVNIFERFRHENTEYLRGSVKEILDLVEENLQALLTMKSVPMKWLQRKRWQHLFIGKICIASYTTEQEAT